MPGPPAPPALISEAEFYEGYRQRLETKLNQKITQIARDEHLVETLPETEKQTFQASLQAAITERDELQRLLNEIHSGWKAPRNRSNVDVRRGDKRTSPPAQGKRSRTGSESTLEHFSINLVPQFAGNLFGQILSSLSATRWFSRQAHGPVEDFPVPSPISGSKMTKGDRKYEFNQKPHPVVCSGANPALHGSGIRGIWAGLQQYQREGLGEDSQRNVDATKTALVGTAKALLGPFPTSTLPTQTASATATATPLISATPTITRSVTPQPTSTRTRIPTFTPRGSNDST